MNPPVIEFNYVGAEILSSRVMAITPSSITLSIQTSKETQLWSLIVPSSTQSVPSESAIMSTGLSSLSLQTNHVFQFSDLNENTEYIIYLTGKETSGTSLGNDISKTKITVKTSNPQEEDWSHKSDGSICPSGWSLSPSTKKITLLECSNNGYCQQSKCMYLKKYS